MTDHDAKMAVRDRIRAMDHPRPGDVYEHYKGGRYRVVMVGCDEDAPSTIRVGYRSETYGSDQFRTLPNWIGTVPDDAGEKVLRFRLVEPSPEVSRP